MMIFRKIRKISVYLAVIYLVSVATSGRAAEDAVDRRIQGWVEARIAHLLAGSADVGRGAVEVLPDLHAREWSTYLYFAALAAERPELTSTLDRLGRAWLQLLDPVWGGVYARTPGAGRAESPAQPGPSAARQSVAADYDKRLSDQAGALRVFGAEYARTRESRYLRAIERVDAYLLEWLADGEGLFFAGQWFHPGDSPAGSSRQIGTADYWQLASEHERRQFGLPRRASDRPLAANAALACAYLLAARVTADPNQLALARRIGLRLQALGELPGGTADGGLASEPELLLLLSSPAPTRGSLPEQVDVHEPLPEAVAAYGLMQRSARPEGSGCGLRGEPEGEFQAGDQR